MTIYSHSKLSTYEQCPLKYKFSYIDRIKRETEGVEAFVGTRVHDVLQKCYDDVRMTKLNSLDDLLKYYDKQWQKNWNDSIVITKKGYDQSHYQAHGRKMIEDYYNRFSPFDSDVTIKTEMQILFSLNDSEQYQLQGYIDRLAKKKDGTYEIHDYKTGSHLPTQKEADEDRQLCLYQIGLQKKWPDVKKFKLIWHYLGFDTDIVSYRDEDQITRLSKDLIQLIDEVEATEEFTPNESSLCDWCEYPDMCPLRKHAYKVDSLPVNEYLKEPGVILVNKYAELKSQASVLDEEINKVREAIVDYAAKEQVTAIKGSDKIAKVKFETKMKFPGKNDKIRPELDEVVKTAGKWDEVSELDTNALVKIVESGKWGKKVTDNLVEYARYEESSSVRLSKLKDEDEE